MNLVFSVLLLASGIFMLISNPTEIFPTMIDGVGSAINLLIKLTAIYSIWLSLLKIMEKTGLDNKLSHLLNPIIKRLFKGEKDETYKWISVNLASNMLGMGGASTPAGIKAMELMEKDGRATVNMDLLVVINATSIQIIPATVIALRATAGSDNPSSIILPTLISSTIATVAGVVLCKVFEKKGENNPQTLSKGSARLKRTKIKQLQKPMKLHHKSSEKLKKDKRQ